MTRQLHNMSQVESSPGRQTSTSAFVMLRHPSGEFIDASAAHFPETEKEFRRLWFHEEGEQSLQQYGEYAPALSLYAPHNDIDRSVQSIANLPTIRDNQMFQLQPAFRQDIVKGLVGPFEEHMNEEIIKSCILDVSRRIPTPLNQTGLTYSDDDFAIALSYKQRSRAEFGGTMSEYDAQVIAKGIQKIVLDADGRRVWVWFDQMLSQTVPNVNSAQWYKYGALPYLVFPVFKYINEDMHHNKFRPWLVFEDTASQHCNGFWCTRDGLMCAYPSSSGRYERILAGEDVVTPGMLLRWRAGLSFVITSLYQEERDRLLSSYEFADSFRHFISWATHLISGQRITEEEKLPWFYRMERSFASLLDYAEEEEVTDVEEWTQEHTELKMVVQVEARKLLVDDEHDGDFLVPAICDSGIVGLRTHDGEVIVRKDSEFKVIPAQNGCDNMLQLITSSTNTFFWEESAYPGTGRIYNPVTKELSLHIMRYCGTLMCVIGVLEELITELDGTSKEISAPSSERDRACFDSFLALQEMDPSVWHFPILYIDGHERRLLQVELLVRDILRFGGALKLQAELLWKFAEPHFEVIRMSTVVHQVRGTRHTMSEPGETWDEEEVSVSLNGCIAGDDSHAAKAALGILKLEDIPQERSSYSVLSGTGAGEKYVDILELDLHTTDKAGEYVCGINNMLCTVSKSNDAECDWHIAWIEDSDVPAHELTQADMRGRVG